MSDLNQFRSKGPELLVELAQHTSETVREIIDIEPAIADQIGQPDLPPRQGAGEDPVGEGDRGVLPDGEIAGVGDQHHPLELVADRGIAAHVPDRHWQDMVARMGGNEFAVLLQGADAAAAHEVARRIHRSFEEPLVFEDQSVDLSAGIGIACWPDDADDADTLLSRSEIAMYAAKRAGGDRVGGRRQ